MAVWGLGEWWEVVFAIVLDAGLMAARLNGYQKSS